MIHRFDHVHDFNAVIAVPVMVSLLGMHTYCFAEAKMGDELFIRGRPAFEERLTVGPDQAELWRQITVLVDQPSLIIDLANLVPIFELTMDEPIDFVSPAKPGPQVRNDLKLGHLQWMIERMYYGITMPGVRDSKRSIEFGMYFELRSICISSEKVESRYGKGIDFVPSHGGPPASAYSHLAGFMHSATYARDNGAAKESINFSYANSGCLDGFGVRVSLPN